MRVGLIGVGWVAATHRATLEQTEAVSLTATADVVPGRADYEDWRLMLAKEDLHAVIICTPPMHHREPAMAAAMAGLAIYLEKPVAGTLEDARAISSAVDASGVVCAVGYQYRALELPAGMRPRALLGRGLSDTVDRPWFDDAAQGGSQILERASHLIDLERAVAGEVERVSGMERSGIASLSLEFDSGALGTVVVGRVPDGPGWSLEIVCDDQTVEIDLDPDPPPIRTSLQRFLEAVRHGDSRSVCCPLSEGIATLEATLACERAVRQGEIVELSHSPST